MKSILLHPHEAARLQSHGEVLVVRPTRKPFPDFFDRQSAFQVDESVWAIGTAKVGFRAWRGEDARKSPYKPGQKVWGKEAWAIRDCGHRVALDKEMWADGWPLNRIQYIATSFPPYIKKDGTRHWWNKRSASSMPLWASRFPSLIAESVSCKMVQSIAEEEAEMTGVGEAIVKATAREFIQGAPVTPVARGYVSVSPSGLEFMRKWNHHHPKHPFASTWAFMTKVRRDL